MQNNIHYSINASATVVKSDFILIAYFDCVSVCSVMLLLLLMPSLLLFNAINLQA